jgi:hypothetical protein
MGGFGYCIFWLAITAIGIWLFYTSVQRDRIRRQAGGRPCQKCGYDLRYSKERCPECGEPIARRSSDYFPLRDEWPLSPISPRTPSPAESPVVIRSTTIAAEAQLILEQFNARGIACWITRQQSAHLIGYSAENPVESSVTVWSEDEAAAREVLDRLLRPEVRVQE